MKSTITVSIVLAIVSIITLVLVLSNAATLTTNQFYGCAAGAAGSVTFFISVLVLVYIAIKSEETTTK